MNHTLPFTHSASFMDMMQHHEQGDQLKGNQTKQWQSACLPQDSLLSMASVLFQNSNGMPAMPVTNNPMPMTAGSSATRDITSQVLCELSDDLFEPASDDIFDVEPTPMPMRVAPQPNQVQSRMALLEETLNQALDVQNSHPLAFNAGRVQSRPLSMNQGFPVDQQPQFQVKAMPAPLPILSTSSSSHLKRSSQMEQGGSFEAKKARLEDDESRRFRPYQAEQWSEKFDELLEFKKLRGHCCVPHTFPEAPALARWVKRQRYQYKLLQERKPSTMTDERVVALEEAGFVWDSHGAAWLERLNELTDYQKAEKHCNVPSNYVNKQLATWVKCQRRQYKLYWESKPSNMTMDRINKLESVGFEWELRGYSKKSKAAMEFDTTPLPIVLHATGV